MRRIRIWLANKMYRLAAWIAPRVDYKHTYYPNGQQAIATQYDAYLRSLIWDAGKGAAEVEDGTSST